MGHSPAVCRHRKEESEESGRGWESKEEENFMENKEKVQPANRGAGEEQRTEGKADLSRDEQEMNHSCARDATTDGRKSISEAPEKHQRCTRDTAEYERCGRCTTCKMHLTMAAIVHLQNQLFRGSRAHGF